ncbi:hypothetical protein EUGRSUZ_J01935 [Eucalyptus grandis]|uniref:Uncharacterized protein n=2 Tax=Eucalyptus grandis TaxID=71139 RepID=A0A059AFX2_EUCGR|nr:hypothetical protein EUGRSUZ_J01935 [Eucalyptus grandis]
MIELNKVHESIFTGNQVAKPSGCRVRPQHPHFLAKRPPKPPKPPFFFGGMATVFLLPVPLPVPFFPSTFLRIGSVSRSWSSFAKPPTIQSSSPFSSLLPPAPFAAVAANTLPAVGAKTTAVKEAIS